MFESIPDVWAIDQVFPIVPIERLDEAPTRRGVIADLTCDSDGTIDTYVETEGLDTSLPLHAPRAGESYRLGIFLVGAYQETSATSTTCSATPTRSKCASTAAATRSSTQRRGDTTDVMLDYVGYDATTCGGVRATRSPRRSCRARRGRAAARGARSRADRLHLPRGRTDRPSHKSSVRPASVTIEQPSRR